MKIRIAKAKRHSRKYSSPPASATKSRRRITVEMPAELLAQAQSATGTGISDTVRTGLQLVAASQTYARLRQLRGKVRFSRTAAELKSDR